MKSVITVFAFLLMLSGTALKAQVENIPLENPVYGYLKLMNLKKIIPSINDDDPNLSRIDIAGFLKTIDSNRVLLSSTEKQLLNKYRVEFMPMVMSVDNSTGLFNPGTPFKKRLSDIFSDKEKYLYYAYGRESNIYVEHYGRLIYSNLLKPNNQQNAKFSDVGLRFSGTLFRHLGYSFSVNKGAIFGSTNVAELTDPRILYNFKYVENNADENVRSYDYVDGYLKYTTMPAEDMKLSVQLGREKQKIGFSHTESLVLSGAHPNMDFIKMTFDFGVMHYTSLFASTVGEFSQDRSQNYTKYIASNRLKLAFKDIVDVGIGESVVFSRGIELAYLNPVIFYKFVEHSLQDRDNGTIFFDFQTQAIKNLQFQGMFFLDENILSNLADLTLQSNKTAYQLGAQWYEPAGIENLLLTAEYTKIRPYTYTHFNPKNTYTSFGQIMGNTIGPNADQIFAKLSYNFTARVSAGVEYRRIRRGENILDASGNLVFNAGGDVFQPYRQGIDPEEVLFLDGNRVNTDNVRVTVRIEPLRDYIFDIIYIYNMDNHITQGFKSDYSLASLNFILNY
jgi:hypothetical protein